MADGRSLPPVPPPVVKPSWNWRRVYTFALTAAMVAFVWVTVDRITDIITLRKVLFWAQLTILSLVFTYVAGATATDWVQIVQAARTSRKISEDVSGAASASDGELPPDQRVNP